MMATFLVPLAISLLSVGLLPYVFRLVGRLIGLSLRSKTKQRREILLERAVVAEDQSPADGESRSPPTEASVASLDDEEWEKVNAGEKTPPRATSANADQSYAGIIGFFHPFCNAGGGGERVLFAAIQATQHRYPKALCVVYTGDQDASKELIISNAHNRFNIPLNAARVSFIFLAEREWVLASRWPRFTLLGQSLGSLILGYEAFSLVVPDVFVDTMGYAFVLALCKWLFPKMPAGAYVHYPTISTDMLSSLHDETQGRGLNAGSGKGAAGKAKLWYWKLFAGLYSWVGGHIDVVMTNSSWTQAHITSLWGPSRTKRRKKFPISKVYPPCAVEELHRKLPVTEESEAQRSRNLIYIAQFRPEKNHQTIIAAFALYLKSLSPNAPKPKLILCGSVRDDQDEKRVYKLRLQALEIKEHVEFVVNAKWTQILDLLRTSSIGVNAMWNEHFGIGVVEYQAAGLISVVNDSGGPKEDIVVDIMGQKTGFHASTDQEYADAFAKALALSPEDAYAMRHRARTSSSRFSEEVFRSAWTIHLDRLVELGRA
ncbi:hypothetical protein BDY17DRAFT_318676 [Neohortaea acidophila]|uniref:GDP-Man:Man(3)GlcNAc(2)-PP-Dol alpha-1,2-mannosyltransferase n=1 Tax=Neohortaea acidophila TaxID=245834 RepID=A0A6A6PJC2_9PEZI|nr:uncharacterized protein BDY17DRAFT_318676 [Neohortaea acidophila]KAF2480158.1 hypothetical protein BDY17DRAFT_318676 [Neohortaea acidophila]